MQGSHSENSDAVGGTQREVLCKLNQTLTPIFDAQNCMKALLGPFNCRGRVSLFFFFKGSLKPVSFHFEPVLLALLCRASAGSWLSSLTTAQGGQLVKMLGCRASTASCLMSQRPEITEKVANT